jgi:transformation/transcription domain-associated protein
METLNILYSTAHKQYLIMKKGIVVNLAPPINELTPENIEDLDFDKLRQTFRSSSVQIHIDDVVKDARFLFKQIILGLESLLGNLKQCPLMIQTGTQPAPRALMGATSEEMDLFIRIFKEGLKCFNYYNLNHLNFKEPGSNILNSFPWENTTLSNEEREILEKFAKLIYSSDVPLIHELFNSQMKFLIDQFVSFPHMCYLAEYILFHEPLSQSFADSLMSYLMEKLENLHEMDPVNTVVISRLFKLIFDSFAKFPETHQMIIKKHMVKFIRICSQKTLQLQTSSIYLLLLRCLLQNAHLKSAEVSFEDMTTIFIPMIEEFSAMLSNCVDDHIRESIVEIIMITPLRPQYVFLNFPLFVKPLTLALESKVPLVEQALKLFKVCTDQLNDQKTEEYFWPLTDKLIDPICKIIHRYPNNRQLSQMAISFLGRLGGKSKIHLKNQINHEKEFEHQASYSVLLQLEGTPQTHSLNLNPVSQLAYQVIKDPKSASNYKVHGFNFIKRSLSVLIKYEKLSNEKIHSLQGALSGHFGNLKVESTPISYPQSIIISKSEGKSDLDNLAPKNYSEADLNAQNKTLVKFIEAAVYAWTIPELKKQAQDLMTSLTSFFSILSCFEALGFNPIESSSNNTDQVQLTTDVFILGISSAISSDVSIVTDAATEILKEFYKQCSTICGNSNWLNYFPIFHSFGLKFSSLCFNSFKPIADGGQKGINCIINDFKFNTDWVLCHENEFITALLSVIKGSSKDLYIQDFPRTSALILDIIKICHSEPETDSKNNKRSGSLNKISTLMCTELASPIKAVREIAQSCFKTLSELTGQAPQVLLSTCKSILSNHIFSKPIRQIFISAQIGIIDCLTYCMTIDPTFFPVDDQMSRVVYEAVALLDAEDEALVRRSSETNPDSLALLKSSCIEFLTAAVSSPEFTAIRDSNAKNRIITVFFKSIYSKNELVVDAANSGLKKMLHQEAKLPKELLQSALKPVLMNLSDSRRLTPASLRGLAKLLQILINYFKVEIGHKLIDHIKEWGSPTVLQECSYRLFHDKEDIKILVALMNIFHLLPPAASMFTEKLITMTIEFEFHLRRHLTSPFRAPLIKFLNLYPADGLKYFYSKLSNDNVSKLFLGLLSNDAAVGLRKEVISNPQDLVKATLNSSESSAIDKLEFQFISIIRSLCTYYPDIFIKCPDFLGHLLNLWRKPERMSKILTDESLSVSRQKETQYLCQILTTYLRRDPTQCEILFELAGVFSEKSTSDFTFLKMFFRAIIHKCTSAQKKQIFMSFLDFLRDRKLSAKYLVQVMKNIIYPMLLVSFVKKTSDEILDQDAISVIDAVVWQPSQNELSTEDSFYEDYLKIELLHLTSLIVRYVPHLIGDVRKNIIKFGWNYLKLEDSTAKQTAYYLIANFIAAFDTPSKIIIPIYVALLKAHQPEVRYLVRQALDTIVPVLPQRIPNSLGDSNFPDWIRWTKKVLTEDLHNIPHVINIYQVVIHHPKLFYPSRDQILPHIVNSLPKLGLLFSATAESRNITVDLLELIIFWEKEHNDKDALTLAENGNTESEDSLKRKGSIEESAPSKRIKQEGGSVSIDSASAYTLPPTMREAIIVYMIRFLCTSNEPISKKGPTFRTHKCLETMLKPDFWQNSSVNLNYFEKSLVQNELTDNAVPFLSNSFEALHTILKSKPKHWTIEHSTQINYLLEKSIRCQNFAITKLLYPVLTSFFEVLEDTKSKHQDIANVTEKVIFTGFSETSSLYSTLTLLKAYTIIKPECIDRFSTNLHHILEAHTKEHLSSNSKIENETLNPFPNKVMEISLPQSQNQTTILPDSTTNIIISIIRMIRTRISLLGENRKLFLTTFSVLAENSTDTAILEEIISLSHHWILEKQESFPTIKEKSGILVNLMSLPQRRPDLTKKYFELILSIYQSPLYSQSELTVRLEKVFLLGTQSQYPELRNKFLQILDSSIPKNVTSRLNYIFGVQNWEFFSSQYWIINIVDIILSTFANTPFILSQSSKSINSFSSMVKNVFEQNGNSAKPEDPSLIAYIVSSYNKLLPGPNSSLDLIADIRQLIFINSDVVSDLWINLFPLCWKTLNKKERKQITKLIINLLSKPYHLAQANRRPNVIQTLLSSIVKCSPPLLLPPQLIKYLGKQFNSWYIALDLLNQSLSYIQQSKHKNDITLQESFIDAITELYIQLNESDMAYGLWKRRCQFSETAVALSFEQHGMWSYSQSAFEQVQISASTSGASVSQPEYTLWQDHWISAASKMQNWDILSTLGEETQDPSLLLESSWRIWDTEAKNEKIAKAFKMFEIDPDSKLPPYKFKFYQAYQALASSLDDSSLTEKYHHLCEEALQSTITYWSQLPFTITLAHLPFLHTCHQFIELKESFHIVSTLHNTELSNLETKAQEIRQILMVWRKRLPNEWDDLDAWSDLLSSRSHIFSCVDKIFTPFLNEIKDTNADGSTNEHPVPMPNNSIVYRGSHEKAWLSNRFAKVIRQHGLIEACQDLLNKIYTLPNIEIQEAFMKIMEHAKCNLRSGNWEPGLDTLNVTNLKYFTNIQKSEFYAMKAKFYSKLNQPEDAKKAFATASQLDISLALVWESWGKFNEEMFMNNNSDTESAIYAIHCFLQASASNRDYKCRKLISKILWLLNYDKDNNISKAFETYRGEYPLWYWISFIPQLLTFLKTSSFKVIIQNFYHIAKNFPQAMIYHLNCALPPGEAFSESENLNESADQLNGQNVKSENPSENTDPTSKILQNDGFKSSTKFLKDIAGMIKSLYPLFFNTADLVIAQLMSKLSPSPEENTYYHIKQLKKEVLQRYLSNCLTPQNKTPQIDSSQISIQDFAANLGFSPNNEAFEAIFYNNPTLPQIKNRINSWISRFKYVIQRTSQIPPVLSYNRYLVEFNLIKISDFEIPGQYSNYAKDNKNFVKINRFEPIAKTKCDHNYCYKVFSIRGQNGLEYPFSAQLYNSENSVKQERIFQLLRYINDIIDRNKESRRKGLRYHIPNSTMLNHTIYLQEYDSSSTTLENLYTDHCGARGIHPDDVFDLYAQRCQELLSAKSVNPNEMLAYKMDIAAEIKSKFVGDDILVNHFSKLYPNQEEYWILRRHFTNQIALLTYLTYVMTITKRDPHKINISQLSGNVWTSDAFLNWSQSEPKMFTNEPVPFRLTPNLLKFITTAGVEGTYTSSLLTLGMLTVEPKFKLSEFLSLILKDEYIDWNSKYSKSSDDATSLDFPKMIEAVTKNLDMVKYKASTLSLPSNLDNENIPPVPINDMISNLISLATNPTKLIQADFDWFMWL